MIQKIDNLKLGDLVVVLGQFQNEIGVYIKHVKRDNIIASITYKSIKRNREERINTRHSTIQRIYKITEDNLSIPQANAYRDILVSLNCITIHPDDKLILKYGETINKYQLLKYIEKGHKLDVVRNMCQSNDLGLRRNKEIADELWHNPEELIKEIFKYNDVIHES